MTKNDLDHASNDLLNAVINLQTEIDIQGEFHPKTQVHWRLAYKPSLSEAQAYIGDDIEMHGGKYSGVFCQVLVDEMANYKENIPPNVIASMLTGKPLIGPAIILFEEARWRD